MLLKEAELAKKLGISSWTIRKWRLKFGLPHIRPANQIFYRWTEVEHWMTTKKITN